PARPDTFGNKLSSGTSAPSSTSSPVIEARRLNLPSIFGVASPLVPRSTMKPRILPPSFAHTTATAATGACVVQDFAPVRDQAVADVAQPGAAVVLRNGRAEHAEPAHFAHDGGIKRAVAIGGEHARKQFLLGVIARGVAHHALFLGQLAFEVERIVPFECG